MTTRRVWSVLLGAVLSLAMIAPPAVAANPPTLLSATITNPDSIVQAGTVCLELVDSGSCSGNHFTGGAWSDEWVDLVDDPANGYPAGDYLIQVRSSTMDGISRWYVADDPAGTTDKAAATPVALQSGAPDLAFEMQIPTLAKLVGYVKDADGVGVANLDVGMVRASGATTFVKTDSTGRYDFGYTQAKTYTLTVNPSAGYGGTSGTAIVPTTTGDYQAPDMTVQLASAIHGQVTDSVSGEPLPLVHVEVFTAGTHQYQGSDYTDLLGNYEIPGLGNQDLVARFSDEYGGYEPRLHVSGDPHLFDGEVPFTLGAGEDREVSMSLVAKTPTQPVHNMSGTVTDADGNLLPGILVTSADGDGLWALTDRLGNWYINAPAGSYRLRFEGDVKWTDHLFPPGTSWAPEYYSGVYQLAEATPVAVAGGLQSGLDATLGTQAFVGLVPPALSGTRAVGRVLTASTGSWTTMALTQFATTWWRGATQVGTGPTYLIRSADAGRIVRARVVATNGTHHATAYSGWAAIAKLIPSVTLGGKSPKPGRVRLSVTVRASGLTPTGTLTVKRGTKIVKRGVALVDGAAVIRLRRQPAGTRRYTVSFGGSDQILPGAAAMRIRVR